MKIILFASFFIVANAVERQLVEKFMAKLKNIGDECIKEVSASSDDIESLVSHKVPDSHQGKCLIFCFHKRFQLQNDDGSVNKEGALKSLEPLKGKNTKVYDKALEVFKTCNEKTPVDSDPCIYSANLAACGVKEGRSSGLDQLLFVDLD